jgi:multidrug efflux pump subunit AcrA (membrane-fusion protein)
MREDIRESVYASGIIKSDHQYQVYATINGLIQEVKVSKGDTVTAGDPLFVISNEVTRLNTENAKLAAELADYDSNINKLNELKINIDLARTRMMNDSMLLARQKKLWDNQIGTKVEMEQRELAFENSRTIYNSAILRYDDLKRQLEFASDQAKKSLKISQSQEDDLTIRSLIDGRIYAIFSEQGEMVSPQTPLAIVGDESSFLLELYVDEYDVVKVKHGQKVMVTLDSYKGQIFEAVITRVYPFMNSRSKTFTTEATFIRAPEILFPNLTLESNIIISSKEDVLTIPRNYLLPDGTVMLKNGDKVKVKTGLMDFNKVEITEGLSETDELKRPLD